MKEYNFSTKRGKQLYEMGVRCCWDRLSNLYEKWSAAKQEAFDWCWGQFLNDENHSDFGVGNANCFGFTASWLLTKNGEECMRVETKDNSYLVYLNL